MSRLDVIIPYFEGERFIDDALASLARARKDHDLHVMVVDDGSSESSNEALRHALATCGLPFTLKVHEENLGIGHARQSGLEQVEADVVGFLDQDDRWDPNLVARLLGLLEQADHASGNIEMVLAPGCARPPWCRPEWLEGPLPGTVVGAGLFRTAVLRQLGGFDISLRNGGDDVELFGRLRRARVCSVNVPEVVLTRLVHEHNASGRTDLDRDLLKSVRAHLGGR